MTSPRCRNRSFLSLVAAATIVVLLIGCSPTSDDASPTAAPPAIAPEALLLPVDAAPKGFEAIAEPALTAGEGFTEATITFRGPQGDELRSSAAVYDDAAAAGQAFAASKVTLSDGGSLLEGAAALGQDAIGTVQTSPEGDQVALYLWREGSVVQVLSLTDAKANTDLWEHLTAEEFHGIAVGLAGATDGA